jgi:hypothetical protein
MKTDQVNRDKVAPRESGRVDESGRSAESMPPAHQQPEREDITGRRRAGDDDLVLHDDDEAELDLPR